MKVLKEAVGESLLAVVKNVTVEICLLVLSVVPLVVNPCSLPFCSYWTSGFPSSDSFFYQCCHLMIFLRSFLRPFLVRRRAPGGLGFVLGAILVLDLKCSGRVSPSGSRGGGGNGNSSPYGLSLIE